MSDAPVHFYSSSCRKAPQPKQTFVAFGKPGEGSFSWESPLPIRTTTTPAEVTCPNCRSELLKALGAPDA